MHAPWRDPVSFTSPDPRGANGEADGRFVDPPDSASHPSWTGRQSAPPAGRPAADRADASTPQEAAIAAQSALGQDLLGLKREIERVLEEQVRDASQAASVAAFGAGTVTDGQQVVGVGLGSGTPAAHAAVPGILVDGPGSPSLVLYVTAPADADEARRRAAQSLGVQALADTRVPVTVVITGIIDASAHRMRLSPAPCGISVGHARVTAGTLGVLATSRRPEDAGKLLILSNNHVLADTNAGAIGDAVLQPAAYDGGRPPGDIIARLDAFHPIAFGGTAGGPVNDIDAAVAWAIASRVRRDFLQLGASGAPMYFRVPGPPVAAALNRPVGKSGRTTGLTQGTITSLANTIVVNYGAGRNAVFRDQIGIVGVAGLFSSGGDSGSLIWTWEAERRPVALLFAGGGGVTFANPIDTVLATLGLDLYT